MTRLLDSVSRASDWGRLRGGVCEETKKCVFNRLDRALFHTGCAAKETSDRDPGGSNPLHTSVGSLFSVMVGLD